MSKRDPRFPVALKQAEIDELLPEDQLIYHIERQSKLSVFEKMKEKYHDIDFNHLLFSPNAKSFEIETGMISPEDTLLTLAIRKKNYEVVRWLLGFGIDKEVAVENGESAFHIAARNDDQKMLYILLMDENGLNLSEIKNKDDVSPFDISFKEFHNYEICANMIVHGTEYDFFKPSLGKPTMEESAQLLQKVCQEGNTNMFNILLYLGISPFLRDRLGNTILHHICGKTENSSRKIFLEYLIKRIGKLSVEFVNEENYRGETALEILLFPPTKRGDGETESNSELIKYFINKLGGDVHHINSQTGLGYLHRSVIEGDLSLSQYILSKDVKFKVNTKDERENISLHYVKNNEPLYRLLVLESKRGVDLNSPNREKVTPFHNLLIHDQTIPLVKLALNDKKLNLKLKTSFGQNVLHLISRFGDLEKLELVLSKIPASQLRVLLEERDVYRRTPLEVAIFELNESVGKILVSKNAKVMYPLSPPSSTPNSPQTRKSSTRASHRSTTSSTSTSSKALRSSRSSSSESAVTKRMKNLLQEAVKRKLCGIVKDIIGREMKTAATTSSKGGGRNQNKAVDTTYLKSLINHKDGRDRTPLHNAVLKNSSESVIALLESKLCMIDEVESQDHCTPLMIACRNGYSEIALKLLQQEAKPNFSDINGRIALHFAARSRGEKGVDICKILIDNGSLINKCGEDGRSPLHEACVSDSEVVVEYLIQHGAKIEGKDGQGMTPLHVAIENGSVRATKCLVSHKADLKVLDGFGRSPLVISSQAKTPQCGKIIILASI